MGLLNRKKKIEKADEDKVAATVTAESAPQKAADVQTLKKGSVKSSRLMIKPLITEKSAVAQSLNKYSFIVAADATKTQIKQAVKEIYGVLPQAVNVINMQGKMRRSGRTRGRRSDYKKALVTLPAGKSIIIHEGV